MADEKVKKKVKTRKDAPADAAVAGEKAARVPRPSGLSDLERKYRESCVPGLMQQMGYRNRMQVPKLSKIVVNISLKEALQDSKILDNAAGEIGLITGQRPMITRAKKSISNFKLRKGQAIGACATLRGRTMYEFMQRLVAVALPRVRDFKGIPPKGFDGRGNYTLGMTDQTIFPEISYDKVQRVSGMNITFVTTARNDDEGRALLTGLGMPFRTV